MTTLCNIPDSVREIFDPIATSNSNETFRFSIETELDGLLAAVEQIEERRPELFRETERCRDLLDNLHYLIDSGPAA